MPSHRNPGAATQHAQQRSHQRAHVALAQVLPHWPDSAEQAMQQPLAAAIIRLVCMGLFLGSWGRRSPQPGLVDRKRAAAGDRDD